MSGELFGGLFAQRSVAPHGVVGDAPPLGMVANLVEVSEPMHVE